ILIGLSKIISPGITISFTLSLFIICLLQYLCQDLSLRQLVYLVKEFTLQTSRELQHSLEASVPLPFIGLHAVLLQYAKAPVCGFRRHYYLYFDSGELEWQYGS